ncbi:hypothetical protein ACQPUZ_08985 [Clostridium tertium]
MILQERIEELGSGILEIKNNKIHLTGFMCKERLDDYFSKNINCIYSYGIYDDEKLDFFKIKDNALFLVTENNEIKNKYLFTLIYKGSFKFKTIDNTVTTRVFKVRFEEFSNKYNLIIEKKSLLFDKIEAVKNYLEDNYKYSLNIKELNI